MLSRLRREDRLIGASVLLTLVGIILGAAFANPNFIGVTAIVVIIMLVTGCRVTRSERLAWLLVFGLVVGVLELWADWVHVVKFQSLVYTSFFGFRLLASPAYMPIGWWLTTVQFGYLALRLSERWPAGAAVAAVTLLGMSLPPWYEEFAVPAKAWYYPPGGVRLSNTPLWVILTYGGCMLGIATMALMCYRPRGWSRAVLAGFFAGASILMVGVFWYSLLGN